MAVASRPLGSSPLPPTPSSLPKMENPFDSLSLRFITDQMKKAVFDLGYKPVHRTYMLLKWEPSVAKSLFEASFTPKQVENFFKRSDVRIVPDITRDLALNEIRETEARYIVYLYNEIISNKTAIHISDDEGENKKILLEALYILTTRPSGRLLLFVAASSPIPIHIHSVPGENRCSVREDYIDIALSLSENIQVVALDKTKKVIASSPPFIIFAHELIHALFCTSHIRSSDSDFPLSHFQDDSFSNFEEKLTITGLSSGFDTISENAVRYEFGLLPRTDHRSPLFPPLDSSARKVTPENNDEYTNRMREAAELGITSEIEKLLSLGVSPDVGLFPAISELQIDTLDDLLGKGGNVNLISSSGSTLLHNAVRKGSCKALRCLAYHGADVDIKDCLGRTPLHLAVLLGRLLESQCLVECRASLDAKTSSRETALEIATKTLNPHLIRLLLENGARVTIYIHQFLRQLKERSHKDLSLSRRSFHVFTAFKYAKS